MSIFFIESYIVSFRVHVLL